MDKIAAEAEHAEATRDAELPYQRRRRVLARHWVIEQLDRAEAGTRDPCEERWERDLRAATEHLRQLLDERPGA